MPNFRSALCPPPGWAEVRGSCPETEIGFSYIGYNVSRYASGPQYIALAQGQRFRAPLRRLRSMICHSQPPAASGPSALAAQTSAFAMRVRDGSPDKQSEGDQERRSTISRFAIACWRSPTYLAIQPKLSAVGPLGLYSAPNGAAQPASAIASKIVVKSSSP